MKVVVINAYVRENAGDAALLSVCLRQVREAFPSATVQIAGLEAPAARPDFEGFANLGSICRFVADGTVSKARRILRRLVIAPLVLVSLLLPPPAARLLRRLLPAEVRREAEAVSEADLVVSMGGGYLYARPGLDGYQNVLFILLPVLLAHRAGVPVVFAPQSYGPFPARIQRWFVALVLNRCRSVLAREDVSMRILAECGITGARRAVDSAFGFAPATTQDWRLRLGVGPDTELIGMTARRWLAPDAQDAYERALAATVDEVQRGGARVVLIPQVSTDYLDDDDRIVERRIAGYCRTPPITVDERVDYRDLKGLYHECSLLVGTRFHSVIFSLTSGVPCIAIEYEHKTRGIMADLQLERWVLPISQVTQERLSAMVAALRSDPAAYRRVLADHLPAYIARAQEFPALLRSVLHQRDGIPEAIR